MLRKISLERDRLRTLIESIPQPVVFFDRSGNLVLYNSNYEELLKVASESLEQILTIFKDTKNIPREFALKTPSGMKWFSLELKEILDEKNTFDGILMVLTDITEQKLQILFWQDRAYQDPLTGIANRNLLEELSENFLDLGEKFSVIMIDLDNFKQLDDKYGHVFGDKILKNFANILKNSIRKDAFLIRYGGDEFTVIISKHGNDLAETIIKRIQSKLEKPFEIDGRKIKLTFCSGIANSPEDGKNIKELINLADKRLYENKKEKAKYLE
ncbi:MAG: diguanylate cyclase [Thermotogae bacterium]|nr:diguanylate cyclase [Thermotogota bacterium]